MAIDTTNLVYLIDPFWQGENNNGRPLVGGHMEVFIAGTDTKYITWQNWDGTKNPFKIPLGSDGRATILVEPEYTYDCYLYDSFNNLAVSRLNVKPNLGGGVYGLSQVYHDDTLTGNGTITSPLGMVSAKLGVQEPLYFVEDDSATVIGLRESAYSGLPYVENSAIGYGMAGVQPYISSISGLGFYALSADSASIAASASLADSASLANSATIADSASISYSAENAGLVTDGWETGSDGRITAYNGTAFSAGKVYSGISPVYVDNENDQIGVSSKDFLANSPLYFTEYSDRVELSISGLPDTPGLMYESGFNYESGKITGYNGSGISAGKVYTGISPVTVDNDNDTISVASAILGVQAPLYFVEDSESATILGVDTASWTIDIPQSADWQNATDIISSNSGNWDEAYSTVANNSGDWQSAADELAVLNTAKWEGAADTLSSHSADWNNKLDADIYAEDSGNFYTKDNPSGFITGVDLTDYATINYVDSSVSGKYDTSSFSAISGTFLTGLPSDLVYTADIQDMATTGQVAEKLDTTAFSTVSGNFLTAVPADYATTAWVTGQGYLTAETDWTNTITAASAYAYSEATAQIPTDYATTAQLADKLDSSIYANDSGTFLTAHQSLPESADWNSAASTVSAGYANWDASYATLTSNSANWDTSYVTLTANSAGWDRISELSGYSANGWSVKTPGTGPLIEATPKTLTASGIAPFTGYLTVSGGVSQWCSITPGVIYLYNKNRSNSAQYIRPDTIVKWNNYASAKLDASVYATDSGTFLTAVPAGTMNESNFGYDASNNITAYNGSAFKAGDEFPQSATEAIEVVTGGSANWNSTTATVSTNSGAWGGSGIEISAGFGINIQLIDNKLVFSLATATGDI